MNRRRFLQSTALAALAVSTGRGFAAESPAGIRKAIMYATVGVKGSVLEKLQMVKASGYEGVELMGGMDRNECVAALKATGLGAASVCCHTHWAKPLSSANPEDRKVGIEGLKSTLVDAKTYGAGSVLFVPGVARDGVSYEQCWDRSIAGIKEAIPVAEETGVVIAIENVWNDFITDQKEAARYLDAIHHPLVKWHFDVGNIIRYGDPLDWIHALGTRISRVHIKEYSRDLALKNGDVWKGFNAKLLEGANNWPGIVKALRESGFSSWAITEQGGGGSPEGLKDLVDRLDKILAG